MLLKLDNLHKGYYTSSGGLARKVLDGLNLEVAPGESLAIIGPSGSGKTTLLNIIAALDQADSGSVSFDGRNLGSMHGSSLDAYRNQSIGIVFQLHHLLPQLSLLENVLLPTLSGRSDKVLLQRRAGELLKRVGVWEQRNQKPAELSGGECQRTAVVRALINQPKLILADEPTGALDEDNAHKLAELLVEIHEEYKTAIILVTHSPDLASRMDRQLVLSKGKLIEPAKA